MVLLGVVMLTATAPEIGAQESEPSAVAPLIEIVEEDQGLWQRWTDFIIEFQRRANAQVATHMTAIQRGDDLGAFFLGLSIAFVYGIFHAFGPGHGKFIVMSYFIGRDAHIGRGVLMSAQIAVVHVIAAIVIVWLADVVLRGSTGMSLADVPGVRAASFLIIAAIGLYMLYQATRAALGYLDPSDALHGHSHSGAGHGGHGHGHSHGHSHGTHGHGGATEASQTESGLIAFAAGVVPCPGAVLIMLYAVANNMMYPGFLLVGAMSVGIGLTICALGVGAILARQTAMRLMDGSDGTGRSVVLARHVMNFGGAILVTLIGLVSFVAFLDLPIA
ncbi:MAG: hypothetical protein AAF679_08240 [Pseudomonadota bacterium]